MRTLILLLSLIPMSVIAQAIKVMNLQSNDILFNPFDNKIYAATASTAGVYGNSICIIDPITATIDQAIFVGSEPNQIRLSDNGEVIFVALDGAAAVRKFNVSTRTAEQQFSLGNDTWSGPFYVEDLEIIKGSDSSIAVSRRNMGMSPKHEGVGIYDLGTVRPNTTQDHTGSNVIEMISENLMVGYNNETTEFGLRTIQIDSNGVQQINVYQNMISGFGVDIYYSNGRIYSTNGKVVDISSGIPSVLATFFEASGPVVEDLSEKVVCYAYQNFWDDEVLIKRYSSANFVIVDTIVVSEVFTSGKVLSLITWGENGKYAFNTSEGRVIIIDRDITGVKDIKRKSDFTIFPNPTVDYVTVSVQEQFNGFKFQLLSLSGAILEQKSAIEFSHTIDMTKYASGTYFLLVSTDQKYELQKIIKQ